MIELTDKQAARCESNTTHFTSLDLLPQLHPEALAGGVEHRGTGEDLDGDHAPERGKGPAVPAATTCSSSMQSTKPPVRMEAAPEVLELVDARPGHLSEVARTFDDDVGV